MMAIKVERRGKYGGVKVHLEPEDCKLLISMHEAFKAANWSKQPIGYMFLINRMGQAISELLVEHPDLFDERTPEQIEEVLKLEKEQAELKLANITKGITWNDVKGHKGKGKH